MKLSFTGVNFMATHVQGPICPAITLRPAPMAPITVADLARYLTIETEERKSGLRPSKNSR